MAVLVFLLLYLELLRLMPVAVVGVFIVALKLAE
jgi:hypothetical protein